MNLQPEPGQLITAPFLPATAEIKKIEPRRGYYRLKMLLRDGSNQFLSQNITEAHIRADHQINDKKSDYLTDLGMRRDDVIEVVGMRGAMRYESEQGWQPEDYVEVKTHVQFGVIRLSVNEWKKGYHFGGKF